MKRQIVCWTRKVVLIPVHLPRENYCIFGREGSWENGGNHLSVGTKVQSDGGKAVGQNWGDGLSNSKATV